MNPEIIVAVALSVVFLVLAAISIPFFIEIWRTTKGISETLRMLNESLPGILRNLEEITTNINRATYTVNNQIENLTPVVRRIQTALEMILDFERVVRAGLRLPFFKTLNTVTAVFKGARVFFDVLRSAPR